MQVREFRIGCNIEELFSNSLRNLRRISDVFGCVAHTGNNHLHHPIDISFLGLGAPAAVACEASQTSTQANQVGMLQCTI